MGATHNRPDARSPPQTNARVATEPDTPSPMPYPHADLYALRYLLIRHVRMLSSTGSQRAFVDWLCRPERRVQRLFTDPAKFGFDRLDRMSVVLSAPEAAALDRFLSILTAARDQVPSPWPVLDAFQAAPLGAHVVLAAREADTYDVPTLPEQPGRRTAWQERHSLHARGEAPLRCPCCCHRTRSWPGSFSICPVCFWEDDGQDDPHADAVWGGPNGRWSLTQARDHFIRYGAKDPRLIAVVREPRSDE